jgi:HEAT repeat protein
VGSGQPDETAGVPEVLFDDGTADVPGLSDSARALVDKLGRVDRAIVRVNAIRALGEIGPDAMPAVPALLDASKSGDLKIATRAVEALAKIDLRSAATRLPLLLDWMTAGQDSTIRLTAMASLRDLGPAAATAIPALLRVADEEDLAISAAAIEAISSIDPATGSALMQAIEKGALRSRDDP